MHATVHGAHAFALHALGQLPLSFEHAVKAVVMRTQTLGRAHVDTQAACHNLGCILDGLGSEQRALELLEESYQALQQALGSHHPRAAAALRNLNRVRHKGVELEMRYRVDAQVGRMRSRRSTQSNATVGAGGPRATAHNAERPLLPAGQQASAVDVMSRDKRVSVFRTHAEVAIAAGRRPRTPVTAGARTPSDLTYLGGGVRVAGDEELSTFDAVKAGVARTARGELPSDGLPDEVYVVQHSSLLARPSMQQQLQQQLQQRLQQQRQQQRQHSHTRGCLPAHAHPHAHPLTRPHSHGHTHGHGHSHSGAGRIQGSELRPGTPRIATRGSVPDAIMSAREPLRNAYNSQGVPYALIPGALPATGSAVRSCSCDAGVLPPAVVDLIGQVLSPKSLERRVTPNPRDTPYLSKAAVAAADAAAAAAATNSQHATPRW